MEYESAERVSTSEGRQYHLDASPGDVAESIVVVGDPDRAARVAERFDEVRFRHQHREYHIHTGTHRGLEISAICVGMGTGSMEIAVVELLQLTRRPTLLRCGSTGALQPEVRVGDLVVAHGSVRLESTSLGYVEPGYPAYAHPEAVLALCQAADEQGARYHAGVGATASGFYAGQGRRAAGLEPREPELLERLGRQGVLNLEMETSCLLTLTALKRLRAGAVCAVYANRPDNVFGDETELRRADAACIDVTLRALHILEGMRQRSGDAPWHPGMGQAAD